MNFLVVGPGAMGCLFAARLKKAGHSVVLLDHNADRAAQVNKQGIRIEGILGEEPVFVPVMVGGIDTVPDVVLFCVKAGATRGAAEKLLELVGPNTRILTLQNGLGNVEILQKIFGKARTMGGVTAEGATLLGNGHVRHAGQGDTKFGMENENDGLVKEIAEAFNDAGFKTQAVDNMHSLIWGKLIINVGINALTAITRLKNGRLPLVSGTMVVMANAVKEAVDVARAKGIVLPYDDPLKRVTDVCGATAANIASMLQDVLKQAVTEVAFINGAVVSEGEALGIPMPVNQTLTCLVQAIEETYDERVV